MMKKQPKIRKHAAWLAAFLTAALVTACSDSFAPSAIPGKAKTEVPLLDETPFIITVKVGNADETAGRAVAGSVSSEINGFGRGMWNYAQIIVLDEDGGLAAWDECRDDGNGEGNLWIGAGGIDIYREYTFLLLIGHWERDYRGAGPENERKYIENAPPTLLAAGCVKAKPGEAKPGGISITMYPLTVHINFTGGEEGTIKTLEPAIVEGKPKAVILEKGNWTANWIIARTGLTKLLYAEGLKDSFVSFNKVFPPAGWKGLIWAGKTAETLSLKVDYIWGKATVDITEYTREVTEEDDARYVNFNLTYQPFGGREDIAPAEASSPELPLRRVFGPWIIRNGINDLPQNDDTDFSYQADWTYGKDNGNGAVAFKVNSPAGSR